MQQQGLNEEQQQKVTDFLGIVNSDDQEMGLRFMTVCHFDLEVSLLLYPREPSKPGSALLVIMMLALISRPVIWW